jgi:tRNA threonylcarbamoyladenosine biosynthesis protein TsaB
MIICLETATNLCSVALCDSDGVISMRESNEAKSHASLLTVFIEEILKEVGLRASQLEAIAVSKGPGSYTGLRIGVSVAKGVAYSASIPLIGIETTRSMFWGLFENRSYNYSKEKDALFCPMLDARRMEIYYALYDISGITKREISAEVINEDSFSNINESVKIIIFGDGAAKCQNIITRKNTFFVDDFKMSSSHMCKPAVEASKNRKYEDVAYFEPFYLKDFITSKPKKNILGK